MLPLETKQSGGKLLPHSDLRGGVFLEEVSRSLEREPKFFSRVITGDESWILEYDHETKDQNRECHTQTVPVPRNREWANLKSNLCSFVFLTVRGSSTRNLWHKENCQSNILSGSPWKTQEKDGTCATKHCTHLDAAPRQRPMSHGSLSQRIFGRKKHSCVSSAPYSPDLSPCDFFLFPRLKKTLERAPFWYFGYYPEECNLRAESYTSRILPALLRIMETTPLSLCSCPRELFWRR